MAIIERDLGRFYGERIVPRFDKMVEVTIAPEVREECKELIAKGWRFVFYGDHQSQGDGWGYVKIVREFKGLAAEVGRDFPGVILPFARSMFTGDQGKILQALTNVSVPYLEKEGVRVWQYTRRKDEDKYGLKRGPGEVRAMAELIREGYDIVYLAEASMDAGRHKNGLFGFIFGGPVKGMIPVDDVNGFIDFYKFTERFGKAKGVAYLPVITEGTYRFLGADIPVPTTEFLQALFIDPSNPARVTVERPITPERLKQEFRENWRDDGAALSRFLMRRVAMGLPPHARGIFRAELDSEHLAQAIELSTAS